MTDDVADPDRTFAREARALGLAWIALIVLMLASLGSAYLRLGAFNAIAGPLIAAIKTGIVAWLFMRLRSAGPLLRLAALTGLAVFAIQLTLTGVDYATRVRTPTDVQRPRQLLPLPRAEPPAPAGPHAS